VDGVMALRGDPEGGPGRQWRTRPGGLAHAVELVRLIRSLGDVPVGVAAFPYGHPDAPSLQFDTEVLAAKQDAGASFAVTQVFFDAGAYAALRERAQRGGVTMPVIPGLMPVTSAGQAARLERFSGASLPEPLAQALRAAPDAGSAREAGFDWTCALVQDLLDLGAPGLHFYTLNNSTATLEICGRVGLRGGS
jgi:methylenetetrahydrofolate reductase (NADPH)